MVILLVIHLMVHFQQQNWDHAYTYTTTVSFTMSLMFVFVLCKETLRLDRNLLL